MPATWVFLIGAWCGATSMALVIFWFQERATPEQQTSFVDSLKSFNNFMDKNFLPAALVLLIIVSAFKLVF